MLIYKPPVALLDMTGFLSAFHTIYLILFDYSINSRSLQRYLNHLHPSPRGLNSAPAHRQAFGFTRIEIACHSTTSNTA